MKAKDLTKELPASPCTRVGGYVLLARMADKGRATIAGTAGEYHFDSPLDRVLFNFKGVNGTDVRAQLEAGLDNEALAAWFDTHGEAKTPEEIEEWGDNLEAVEPHKNPEMSSWFPDACKKIGLDPVGLTLFDYLEADDRATIASHA